MRLRLIALAAAIATAACAPRDSIANDTAGEPIANAASPEGPTVSQQVPTLEGEWRVAGQHLAVTGGDAAASTSRSSRST